MEFISNNWHYILMGWFVLAVGLSLFVGRAIKAGRGE